jgi:hypothetical protein
MTASNVRETIDITPTWQGILPAILMVLDNGSDAGKNIARDELKRMATLADRYVASQSTAKE